MTYKKGGYYQVLQPVMNSGTAATYYPPPMSLGLSQYNQPPAERADNLGFDERMRASSNELEYRSPDGVTFKVVLEPTGEVCLGLTLYIQGDADVADPAWCVVPADEALQFFDSIQTWMTQLRPEES